MKVQWDEKMYGKLDVKDKGEGYEFIVKWKHEVKFRIYFCEIRIGIKE